ncbi:MAG TPA: C-terminal binding protein [Rhodospirillales bacterium]|jgi:D-3-phosphoglycerate dehydrogenase|nr:C-terminal binding protein [Rhodospirillales bacterium]
MGKTLVAVADSPFPNLNPAEAVLSELDAEMVMADEPTLEGILKVAAEADGLMVTYGQITADVIKGLKKCKVIGRFGLGVDNIDIDAATKAGIAVVYVPDYCIDEVSDHAMAMLLDLARKVSFSNSLVQAGRWEMPAVTPLSRLRGRTLGLAGLGQIPRAVAPKAQSFGLKVIAYDPFVDNEVAKALDVELVDLDTLLESSNYVSVHVPMMPETEKMFGADAFKKMKADALLVNTARGPLVDTDALAEALDAGEIGGAALDVMPVEPPGADHPLLGRDNVILSPHTGFYSIEALEELQTKTARGVVDVLQGNTPVYPINPEVLK